MVYMAMTAIFYPIYVPMEFPFLIDWESLFPILEMPGIFYYIFLFELKFCFKQAEDSPIFDIRSGSTLIEYLS